MMENTFTLREMSISWLKQEKITLDSAYVLYWDRSKVLINFNL